MSDASAALHRDVGLPWLATARWATLAAQAGAALMGATILAVPVRWPLVAAVLAVTLASNLWLMRQRGRRQVFGLDVPALLVVLFVAVTPELDAALAMHPEVARHFQGMWWAFAATAALVTTFVARLAGAVAQRARTSATWSLRPQLPPRGRRAVLDRLRPLGKM